MDGLIRKPELIIRQMLKKALPNKGSLSEESRALISEAGYNCKRYSRELKVTDVENQVEFIFLRPRDIAVYVQSGIIDLGITGRDLAMDSDVPGSLTLDITRNSYTSLATAHCSAPRSGNEFRTAS